MDFPSFQQFRYGKTDLVQQDVSSSTPDTGGSPADSKSSAGTVEDNVQAKKAKVLAGSSRVEDGQSSTVEGLVGPFDRHHFKQSSVVSQPQPQAEPSSLGQPTANTQGHWASEAPFPEVQSHMSPGQQDSTLDGESASASAFPSTQPSHADVEDLPAWLADILDAGNTFVLSNTQL